MKKVILILTVCIAFSKTIFAQSGELPHLGIISQLVEIKFKSECYLASVLQNTASTEAQKKTALANYNAVKIKVDQIIYQLIAELRAANSIKKYKALDKYYKSHKFSDAKNDGGNLQEYVDALSAVYKTYKDKIIPEGRPQAAMDVDAILSILEFGWNIVKDLREMNGKKVDAVIEILNNLRLSPSGDLTKKEEKK